MKIAILGYAGQGQSAYEYWEQDGNHLTICDSNKNIALPKGANGHLGKDYLSHLDKFDLLIRTPALHPKDIVNANPKTPDILDKVTTVTNEFFRVCPTRNIIGVTGTKGKGTTSTLIAKMLEASGKRVHLGGNIGIPPLELLKNSIKPDDWVVLELANFQLTDIRHSPHIGVCLMVTEEHLNWHLDMEEYIVSKQQMFKSQQVNDFAVYFAGNEISKRIAQPGHGRKIPYFAAPGAYVSDDEHIVIDGKRISSIHDIRLLGKHNLQNICAAVTAFWQVAQDIEAIRWVLHTFTGLEHRLELVRELKGIKYYDDSFGTTPETAIVAIEAFEEPKIVILGGSDKGAHYDKLAMTVKNHNVKKVVLIGDTAPAIKSALVSVGFNDTVEGGKTMGQILSTTHKYAEPGDVVLLSTGCASFGLFNNYKDRGEQFKQAVQALS